MAWLKKEPEVLVVGAGPVGLYTALELARRGIGVRILDEQWRTTSRSYALCLHPRTLELLDAHDLAEALVPQGHRLEATSFYDGKRERARVSFETLGVKYPFVLVLPQHALESALERKLAEHKVEVEWNHRAVGIHDDGTKVVARIQRLGKESVGYAAALTEWVVEKESSLSTSYLVGTDGHRSAVRRAAGIGYGEAGRQQLYAVFEFQADLEPLREARVVFGEETTDVLWSMRGGRFRWGFQVVDPEMTEDPRSKSRLLVGFDADAYPALDPGKLTAFIAERAPWFTATILEVFWSAAIRFERRLADQFGAGRIWLAGDSAHLAGPVGMHSMNVGLREARDLAWCLARRLREPGVGETLAGYGSARAREWRQLLGLERGPQPRADTEAFVKANAPRILECTPASGSVLQSALANLGLDLTVEEEWVQTA